MAHILVVDDSPEQARFIATLLESEDYTVEIAPDGASALEAMSRRRPDLVATDLVMPGMDGLALVEAIRESFPAIPVLLLTAFGSAEIAVKALQTGAASYVPKRLIRQDLADTVESTLEVSQAARERTRALASLQATTLRFSLENDHTLVSPLVGYIQERVQDTFLDDGHSQDLLQIGVALQEALFNAMHHGNLQVGSELRREDTRKYYEKIKQRQSEKPYCDRRVRLTIEIGPNELKFDVLDEGAGFDPQQVPDPTDPANLDRVHGRGLYLISTFMDQVVHNEIGNRITMIKRIVEENLAASSG
ncbi:MAG: response regulator [bacterium]|nr:response regulator [bacterium]